VSLKPGIVTYTYMFVENLESERISLVQFWLGMQLYKMYFMKISLCCSMLAFRCTLIYISERARTKKADMENVFLRIRFHHQMTA